MKRQLLFHLLLLGLALPASAGSVDTVTIFSSSMNKAIKCVVVKPDRYQKKKLAFPVVYLLHGYGGHYGNWITRVPQLRQYADRYQVLIVCPDGGYSSWYLDSPLDTTMRYETHVGAEVPAYIDAHYRTLRERKYRAITGLSMGGHGGLFLGLRHSGTFGACGSMSGGVDLNASRNKYDIIKRIGDTLAHAENWKTYSVANLVEHIANDTPAIIIDCGTEDFFYNINQALHQKMLTLKIPHDYTERPGQHNWDYWRNAVQYQLLFFSKVFEAAESREMEASNRTRT